MFFLLSPRLINFAEIVVAFMTLMGLQLLQGFAGAATPREGRWLLRHEGSSWEMDVICFGRVRLWTIHQRKMVPTRHRVIVVDMFLGGVFRKDEPGVLSFVSSVTSRAVLHREVKGQSTHSPLQCLFCQSWSQLTPRSSYNRRGVMYSLRSCTSCELYLCNKISLLEPGGFTAKALGKFNNIFEVLRLARGI